MASQLSRDEVTKIAHLGRLKLTEAELDSFATQLGEILGYVDLLNEVDTEDVEPMAHAVELTNVFRTDAIRESLPREEALSNAPKTDGRFFLVPQILESS